MQPLLVMLVLLLYPSLSSAAGIYIAQSASGGDTGVDCANAHSVVWLNTAGNWSAGVGQIGPGTVVHLCGTLNLSAGATFLTTQGSGANGNRVIIQFETNAVVGGMTGVRDV